MGLKDTHHWHHYKIDVENKIVGQLKECKWCERLMEDEDDFCSPECLESYALEFLKKKK